MLVCRTKVPAGSGRLLQASMASSLSICWPCLPAATAIAMSSLAKESQVTCVAMCCSVMPCVSVCCSILQCVASYQVAIESRESRAKESRVRRVAVCRRELQCVAVCVAVCCHVVQCVAVCSLISGSNGTKILSQKRVVSHTCCNMLQCVAVRCSLLQCVAELCLIPGGN